MPTATRNDGGPAFPTDHSTDAAYTDIQGGMTLRDYFAAKALGCLVGCHLPVEAAALAYELADAMLNERERR